MTDKHGELEALASLFRDPASDIGIIGRMALEFITNQTNSMDDKIVAFMLLINWNGYDSRDYNWLAATRSSIDGELTDEEMARHDQDNAYLHILHNSKAELIPVIRELLKPCNTGSKRCLEEATREGRLHDLGIMKLIDLVRRAKLR